MVNGKGSISPSCLLAGRQCVHQLHCVKLHAKISQVIFMINSLQLIIVYNIYQRVGRVHYRLKLKLGRRYNCHQCINKSTNVGLVVCFKFRIRDMKVFFLPWYILILHFSLIFLSAWNVMEMLNEFKSFAFKKLWQQSFHLLPE